MPDAPSGFLGKLSAERPLVSAIVLALAVTLLCVLGLRQSGDPSAGVLISSTLLTVAGVVWAPMLLAAVAPRGGVLRILYLVLVAGVGAAVLGAAFGRIDLGPAFTPPLAAAGAAVSYFLFLFALAPMTGGALRLVFVAPAAAMIGLAGGLGYHALEGVSARPLGAAAASIALALGVSVGTGIGADFARYFARGFPGRKAAAAAGHAAVAPAAFGVLAAAACAAIVSLHTNFGAVDWTLTIGAAVIALLCVVCTLTLTTAALASFTPGEAAAVDENRRRRAFAESWRPFRRHLAPTTAVAASAIAGVLVVIALFEVGVAQPVSLAGLLFSILVISGVTFVSIRTSLLIAMILFLGAVYADYVYAVFDIAAPAMPERFVALTLAAIALSQLTVSWRNAGDGWRKARDIAENAMNDGMRRFIIAYGAGGASLIAVAHSFAWEEGLAAAAYFGVLTSIAAFLAPVLMVALSAQFQR